MFIYQGKKIKQPQGLGSSAEYYKISPRRGIKVFHRPECGFESKFEIKYSSFLESVTQEFKNLKTASKLFPFVIKGYSVGYIKCSRTKRWHAYIEMEHATGEYIDIDSLKLLTLGSRKIRAMDFKEEIEKSFAELGCDYSDLHSGNVIVSAKGNIKVIDLDGFYKKPDKKVAA